MQPRRTATIPAESLDLQTVFDPAYGEAVAVAPSILRVTAENPGPFTFRGTNTYVVGDRHCLIVDPGPDIDAHRDAIMHAVNDRPVDAILLTHTHRDHTGLVPRLQEATGAPVIGEGPHRPSRSPLPGEEPRLDASGDIGIRFDRTLADGETIGEGETMLTAIATPGHCVNHLAYAVGSGGTVLSGDHVMAWSTTIVAPPDGSMRDYMASLEKLLQRDDRLYLPGHGGPVVRPKPFLRGLVGHRRMREAAILKRLRDGDRAIGEIVAALYASTDPRLHGAAGLSVLAHLEDLLDRGLVVRANGAGLRGSYALARS